MPALDDAAATALAREEASALLEMPLTDVLGAGRVRLQPAAPASALGHPAATEAARAAIGAVGGLSAVGGWLAGSGLAQVVPDAVATADDARRHALWGETSA